MKRIVFFVLLLTSAIVLRAEYHPMLAIGKQWNYVTYTISFESLPTMMEEMTLHTESIIDTIKINGKKYHVIKDFYTDLIILPTVYMREDSIAQKVWILTDETAEEQLLYCFDVSVGDTLRNITFYPIDNWLLDISRAEYIVTDIGSVEGRKSVKLHAIIPYNTDNIPDEEALETPYEKDFTWIEGIGEKMVGLSATQIDDDRAGGMYANITALLCVQQDHELLYSSNYGQMYGCEFEKYIEEGLDDVSSGKMTCTYVNGFYIVTLPESERILSMQIYDCNGKQILSNGYAQNTIPASIQSNVYLLIVNTNKKCYHSKIIIQ